MPESLARPALEIREARRHVAFLSRLVVLATDDQQIVRIVDSRRL